MAENHTVRTEQCKLIAECVDPPNAAPAHETIRQSPVGAVMLVRSNGMLTD